MEPMSQKTFPLNMGTIKPGVLLLAELSCLTPARRENEGNILRPAHKRRSKSLFASDKDVDLGSLGHVVNPKKRSPGKELLIHRGGGNTLPLFHIYT